MSVDKNIRDEIQEELAPFMKISDEIISSRQRRRERQQQIKTDQLETERQEQEQQRKKE